MTLKHLLKRQNRLKNKIRKITVESRNDVEVLVFDMFYVISQPLLSNILHVFLKILILRGKFWKRKGNV